MSADKQKVFNILEMRFDYQSSRNVFYNWRKTAGIREECDTLNDEDLKSLLSYLKENAAGADRVYAAIERLILATDNAPVEEAHVEEATPVVEEAHVEEAAPVVEDATVEEAPAEVAYTEEAPAEDAYTEEAPAEDAASEEAPAEEAKSDDNQSEGGKKKKKSRR